MTRPRTELPTGNQVGVVATDLAHKVLVESCVVACKMNPVNEYQGPLLEHIFAPLVRACSLFVRRQCASGREQLLSSRVRFRVRTTGRWTRALCSSCTVAARCVPSLPLLHLTELGRYTTLLSKRPCRRQPREDRTLGGS